jgi:hypothetical protein
MALRLNRVVNSMIGTKRLVIGGDDGQIGREPNILCF